MFSVFAFVLAFWPPLYFEFLKWPSKKPPMPAGQSSRRQTADSRADKPGFRILALKCSYCVTLVKPFLSLGLNFLFYKMKIKLSVLEFSWGINEMHNVYNQEPGMWQVWFSCSDGAKSVTYLIWMTLYKMLAWNSQLSQQSINQGKKYPGQLSVNCHFHCYNYVITNHHSEQQKPQSWCYWNC